MNNAHDDEQQRGTTDNNERHIRRTFFRCLIDANLAEIRAAFATTERADPAHRLTAR